MLSYAPLAAGQDVSPPRVVPPHLGLEAVGSVLARLTSSPGYEEEQRFDTAYAAGFSYTTADQYAVGLRYEYMALGGGESTSGTDWVDADYLSHLLWITTRYFPYSEAGYHAFVGTDLGLSLMKQKASGVRTVDTTQPAGEPFKCSTYSSPNIAVGATGGVAVDVGDRFSFVAGARLAILRGTSQLVDDCVTGAGSPVMFGVNLAFAYLWGV